MSYLSMIKTASYIIILFLIILTLFSSVVNESLFIIL